MRARTLSLSLSLLMLSACGLLSGERTPTSSTPATTATRPPPTRTPTATPEPPPPDFYDIHGNPLYFEPQPRELVELMQAQVAAGEITLEEGVLGLMRLLADEGDLPAYAEGGDGELTFDSGWGLSLMAYELYQESDDPELKAELERLLRKLAPPQEALDRYAMPAEEYEGGAAPGLQRSVDLQIPCDEIWHEGFPESAGPVPTCLLYDWFIAGGHEFRVYYPTELANNAGAMARVAGALQALKDSQAVYSKLVEVRSINLVFSLVSAAAIGGSSKAVAMVPGFAPGDLGSLPCPIVVFNKALQVPVPTFKQIMAHEVFHCIHLWRKGYSGYVYASWYNEGMATYFSNVVYPKVNAEHVKVAQFHEESITRSIFEMTYPNTVLFQYLGKRFGDPWLIALMDGMPFDPAAMVSYMAGLPEMEDVFRDFGRAYMETKIEDTGGGFLPGSPAIPSKKNIGFPGGGPLTMEAKPFHIERAALGFQEGRNYTLDLALEGDPATESSKHLPAGAWGQLPAEIVACAKLEEYVLVLTTTAPGSFESTAATYEIELADSKEAECDPCLVGVWERDMADSSYWDAVRAATADLTTSLDSVSGLERLTFYADGQYTSQTEDFVLVWVPQEVAGPLGVQSSRVVTTTQRSGRGTYHTITLSLLVMVEKTFDFHRVDEVLIFGPVSGGGKLGEESESGESEATGPPMQRPYTCTPTTLSYHAEGPIFGAEGETWTGEDIFKRVSSTPPPLSPGD